VEVEKGSYLQVPRLALHRRPIPTGTESEHKGEKHGELLSPTLFTAKFAGGLATHGYIFGEPGTVRDHIFERLVTRQAS
jgi:hypothetical protein